MRRALIFISAILFSVAAGGVTAGPRRACTLSGTVIGPDDKPVAHASVSYQSSGGNAPHAVHTNSQGQFSIPNLKADDYDIRASAKGIFSDWEKNVSLRPGQSKSIELRLIYAKEMPKAVSSTKPKP
jgi:hypothetical protein